MSAFDLVDHRACKRMDPVCSYATSHVSLRFYSHKGGVKLKEFYSDWHPTQWQEDESFEGEK